MTINPKECRASKLRFSVDSHLLQELGERLVSRESIALAELVKNSYDADATKVTLHFHNVSKPGGTIIVDDDGEGIPFEELSKTWMRIATDEKERNPVSKRYHRARTGSKGVGRFACQLISNRLILESVSKYYGRSKEKIRAVFDWKKFEPGTSVNDVSVEFSISPVSGSTPTGTKLILEDTRSAWPENVIIEMQRDIMALTNPLLHRSDIRRIRYMYSDKNDPGFLVKFEIPEHKDLEKPLSSRFLEAHWGKLIGRLKDGKASYKLKIRPSERIESFTSVERFPSLGEASFIVYYLLYKPRYFSGLPFRSSEAQEVGLKQGGIGVYLDGFKVFHYGKPGDDWLKLERDRSRRITGLTFEELVELKDVSDRAILFLPGTNQLFGAVFLSRKANPNVLLTVTRDKLVENTAFNELERFVRLGIEWMTIKYAKTVLEEKSREIKVIPKIEAAVGLLTEIESKIKNKEDILGATIVSEILHTVNLAKDVVSQEKEERISEIATLRVLATTGGMVAIFDHELSMFVSELTSIREDLKKYLSSLLAASKTSFEKILDKLRIWTKSIEQQAAVLGLLLGRESRERRRSLALKQTVDELSLPFERYFKEYGIEFLNEVPAALRTPPFFRCELMSLLLNLLTNSIKAVRGCPMRKICVRASASDEEIQILFLDSGKGLPPERRQEVFMPFVSYSEPDLTFGSGTGLGLSIVKDIVDTYGGEVNFVDPPNGWGACVKIVLPKEV